jgi:6-phosphogluconate dehydrogenase
VVEKLPAPRIIWIMLPAGSAVDAHLVQLKEILSPGDVLIDGGNTYYKDDIQRAESLSEKEISFLDVGVSGGIWGRKEGYCLMIGGARSIYEKLEPLFKTLAPRDGYLYCGPSGAGHFVKMVHNGIEYGMMQAYGEGFQILEASPYAERLNYAEVAHLWNQGSVVRSWLLELAEAAFTRDHKLTDIKGVVEDSGEGRWTVDQAIETGVSAPVIALSLMARFRSKETDAFSDKLVAALRREFGGHAVVGTGKK